jgi:hypothetical protein
MKLTNKQVAALIKHNRPPLEGYDFKYDWDRNIIEAESDKAFLCGKLNVDGSAFLETMWLQENNIITCNIDFLGEWACFKDYVISQENNCFKISTNITESEFRPVISSAMSFDVREKLKSPESISGDLYEGPFKCKYRFFADKGLHFLNVGDAEYWLSFDRSDYGLFWRAFLTRMEISSLFLESIKSMSGLVNLDYVFSVGASSRKLAVTVSGATYEGEIEQSEKKKKYTLYRL